MTDIIVVDLETTGLSRDATILEVAAVNIGTDEQLRFVPYVAPERWSGLEPQALSTNRYFEREVWQDMLTGNETREIYAELRDMLRGKVFAGSNPSFDAGLLERQFEKTWHHRLLDLSAFAFGQGIVSTKDPTIAPGLDDVAAALNIGQPARHSALGDALTTAECFRRLGL